MIGDINAFAFRLDNLRSIQHRRHGNPWSPATRRRGHEVHWRIRNSGVIGHLPSRIIGRIAGESHKNIHNHHSKKTMMGELKKVCTVLAHGRAPGKSSMASGQHCTPTYPEGILFFEVQCSWHERDWKSRLSVIYSDLGLLPATFKSFILTPLSHNQKRSVEEKYVYAYQGFQRGSHLGKNGEDVLGSIMSKPPVES